MCPSPVAHKTVLASVAVLGLLCMLAGTAYAASAHSLRPSHAKVLSADPAIGSTIQQAPTKVTVFAAENINPDPTKSNLQVYGPSVDATDTLISQGNAQVSLSNPKEMSVSITPNSGQRNGVYVVFWKTVSADDGDPAAGSFTFTVNPNGVSATPTPVQKSASTPANATSMASSGALIWVPIVVGLITLIIGLGAGLALGRRKPATSPLAAMRASLARETAEDEATKQS